MLLLQTPESHQHVYFFMCMWQDFKKIIVLQVFANTTVLKKPLETEGNEIQSKFGEVVNLN